MADKLAGGIKAGSVDVSIEVVLRSTGTNLEVTGKVAADVTGSYWRQGGVRTAITGMSNLGSVNAAHADGGWIEVDATNMPGVYRIDFQDAAFATGADWVMLSVKVANCYVFFQKFGLTTDTVQTGDNFARLGAPAGASVSADIASVKTSVGSVTGAVGSVTGAVGSVTAIVTSNVTQWNSVAIASPLVAGQPLVSLDYGTTSGKINLSGGNLAGAVPSVSGAVGSVTGAVGSVTGNVSGNVTGSVGSVAGNVSGNVTGSVGSVVGAVGSVTAGVTLAANSITSSVIETTGAAEIADAVWDEATSGHTGLGSTGKALTDGAASGDPWAVNLPGTYTGIQAGKIVGDNVNATISSRAPEAGGNVAAIKTQTDKLGFSSGSGFVDANVEKWNATLVPAEHTPGYPIITVKDGTAVGEINTNAGAIVSVESITNPVTADVTKWKGTTVGTPDVNGYPSVTIKGGINPGELVFNSGILDVRVVAANGPGQADISTAVNSTLNSATPGSPAADSIYERVNQLDNNYTAARAPNLDKLDANISTRATPADVDAEMRDVLATELLADPAQGAPSATPSIKEAQALLYFYLRNQVTNDGTTLKVFRDDGTTVAWKRPVSEVAGLFTRGEAVTGP